MITIKGKGIVGDSAPELGLVREGLKLVTLTFGINLYTDVSFYEMPEAVLGSWDLFLRQCPADALTFYATEVMRRHKPVTNQTLDLPGIWLSTAPRKDYFSLELKSAEAYQDAPDVKYQVWSAERSPQSKALSIALPADRG